MSRAIDIKPWTLHQSIQSFDKYCDEGMIDMNYHKIGLKIARNEYRASGYIPVIVDRNAIHGAFGVGIKKLEKKGLNQEWDLRY